MKKQESRLILLSLIFSIVLTAGKFVAYFLTYSIAVLSDALESIINVVAATFAFYSIYLSAQPKDKNHPYGHGKVEFFSIGVEGAMIFIAGCLILFKSVQFLFEPQEIRQLDRGMIIVGVTAVVNFGLGRYLIRAGKRLSSITLSGNGQHLLTDAYSTVALIFALVIIRSTHWNFVDPIFSTVVGILILRNGYGLIRRSVSGLMDEADMQAVDRVIEILSQHRRAAWIDVHNMRIQQYGNNYHIDCHITLPYYFTLSQAHEEMKALDQLVNQQFKKSDVEFFIHADPCIPSSCKHCLLEACPVRSAPFESKIEWSRENVLPNHKHGEK